MEEVLQEREWETQAFATGADALATVPKNPPGVIPLDIRLREAESGWSVLHRLKADPVLAEIPVVLLSGDSGGVAGKTSWLDDHGIDVLAKPFDLDDLYRTVEAALDGSMHPLARGI